jgi:transposase
MENLSRGLSRRKFRKEFKIAALGLLAAGVSIAAVARSCEINPSLLHRWRRDCQQSVEQAFPGLGKKGADENRVAELERKIGQQASEIDFLKRCLQRIEEQRMLQALTGKPLSTRRSGKK